MTKLFIFGACDLYDIVESKIITNNYKVINQHYKTLNMSNRFLEISNMQYPGSCTSLRSLYRDPGSLALRVYETLINCEIKERLTNRALFQEFMKFPYLEFFKKHSSKNDYLILSFSSEVYSKFQYKNELVTCLPAMFNITEEQNPCHWLYKDYMSKDEMIHSFDERDNLNITTDYIKKFAEDIHEIFHDRVILVKTHFTKFSRHRNKVFEFKTYADTSIPFYKRSKLITDSRDIDYISRNIRNAEKIFRKSYKEDIPYISIKDQLYVDADHKWGASQFHLDDDSKDKIAQKIHKELKKKIKLS